MWLIISLKNCKCDKDLEFKYVQIDIPLLSVPLTVGYNFGSRLWVQCTQQVFRKGAQWLLSRLETAAWGIWNWPYHIGQGSSGDSSICCRQVCQGDWSARIGCRGLVQSVRICRRNRNTQTCTGQRWFIGLLIDWYLFNPSAPLSVHCTWVSMFSVCHMTGP